MDTKVARRASLPADSIDSSGYPLGFMVEKGSRRPGALGSGPGRDVFVAETRQFGGHQKEAVVREGDSGSRWRIVSDEGKHLGGTDLAPFPLGYFNAGLHADLGGRIIALAAARGLALSALQMEIKTRYSLTGSFTRGDAVGTAEPVTIEIEIDSPASGAAVRRLVADALGASPAIAALRTPLTNTFAIYVNGRRRSVTTLAASKAADAADPFRTYVRPPAPLDGARTLERIVHKTGEVREGEIAPAPAEVTARTIRVITGNSRFAGLNGICEVDAYLSLPGVSHFAIKADERPDGDEAPCGLSHIAAGIVFCYMTQISRYIEHMKLDIHGTRIVQLAPYGLGADRRGGAEPVDTHLFFNGEEGDEMHERLMLIAARTCYLHATLAAALEPEVIVIHNGKALD
jgi:uncharacterized OsmC-like protein